MSKKMLKMAGRRPILLALIIMATVTIGLLLSGWFTPAPGRAQPGQSNPRQDVENCDNPTTTTNCAAFAQVVLSNIVMNPAAPANAPYDSIVCVGDTITASLFWFTLPSTNQSITCHNCDGSTPTNWCDDPVYSTGDFPINITNGWWTWYIDDSWWVNRSTNGLGDSVSFCCNTNAELGVVWFDNVSAQMPASPSGCGVWAHWGEDWGDNGFVGYRYYAIVEVGDLAAQGYYWPVSDDGTNKVYRVCVVPANAPETNVTVIASPNPAMDPQWLPYDWILLGGRVTNKVTSLVDITKPGTTEVTCIAGVKGLSYKTVTIIAQQATLGIASTNVVVNNDDDNGDGIPDVNDPTSGPGSKVDGESDLIAITLNVQCVAPTQMVTLSVSPDWWGGGIRVWPNSTRGPGSPLLDNSDANKCSTNWPASQMPTTLWVEGVSPSWSPGDVELSLGIDTGCGVTTNLTVMQMQLGADVSHTRTITYGTLATNYFWINDVAVSGNTLVGENDVPGSGNNGNSGQVNGRADVENFFPVVLDFGNTLQWLSPTNGYQYRLTGSGVSIAYTALNAGQAFNYLTNATGTSNYGSSFGTGAYAADTVPVDGYAILSTRFLTNALNNGGAGLVLMEGGAATTTPLKLEVWKNGQKVGSGGQLNLSIDGVEKMYRWINLRAGSGLPTSTGEPKNFPDLLSNGKNVFFLHGFLVTTTGARGWSSEMFKRLYWSGSRA